MTKVEATKKRFADLRAQILAGEHGGILVDLAEANHGAQVASAFDAADRISRQRSSPDGGDDETIEALGRLEMVIDSYSDEATQQQVALGSMLLKRKSVVESLDAMTFQFKELEASVRWAPTLDANPEIQTSLRLASSSLRYCTSRLTAKVSAAWVKNDEVKSEEASVEELRSRLENLEALSQAAHLKHEVKSRDQKIAQSTLDLALSKLEGLARTVLDSGVNKESEVQRAIEASEDAYLQARRRFGYDDCLDSSAADDLVKKINEAESIAKQASLGQQERARQKESINERVNTLVSRLSTVVGMCDASGPLVAERVHELVQGARASVNTVMRLSRRDTAAYVLESSVDSARQDVQLLEKTAATVRDEVAAAEETYNAARQQLEDLGEVLHVCKSKADTYGGAESVRGVGAILSEADTAIKLCRLHMLGVQSWLADSTTLTSLLEDAVLKVEMAEEEVDRDFAHIQSSKQERDLVDAKLKQLRARHEKVCRAIKQLKTTPPARLVQAIAATDKAMSEALSGRHSVLSVAQMENLVKEEEDMFQVEVRLAEKRLLDLEKAATQVPTFLQKLASMNAQVEAAGVVVAALVESELGEAHRAVRSVEHALDTDVASPTSASLQEVEARIKAAEEAVETQVRRFTNAVLAQQEAKSQLGDIQLAFDDMNEAVVVFSAQSNQLNFQLESETGNLHGSGSAWNVKSSPSALGMRLIFQATKRCEQLVAHARRRIEVPVGVWMEYGPAVAQNALDNAREGVKTAKAVVDAEQAKLDSNNLERRTARETLEDCSHTVVSLRAMVDGIADSTDVSASQDAVDGAERAVEVALRVLAHGTVASSAAAMEVAVRKTSEAETLCTAAVDREERISAERKDIREKFKKTRAKLDAAREAGAFLDILNSSMVRDSLSAAERALIGVDLVLKCEFGLPMLRKEFQAAAQAVDLFVGVVEREKCRMQVEQRAEIKRKHEERIQQQRAIEIERARAMEETLERRAMQDKLEAAIHRLQLHWPAVVDVQNSMSAAETSVEAARTKLASGGLAAANAAVSSALSKVHSLEQVAKSIEATIGSSVQHPAVPEVPSNSSSQSGQNQNEAVADLSSDMGLLHHNLEEVNSRIERQNQIMSIQYKLIMASSEGATANIQALQRDLDALTSSS